MHTVEWALTEPKTLGPHSPLRRAKENAKTADKRARDLSLLLYAKGCDQSKCHDYESRVINNPAPWITAQYGAMVTQKRSNIPSDHMRPGGGLMCKLQSFKTVSISDEERP